MNEPKKNKSVWVIIGWIALIVVAVTGIVLIVNAMIGGAGDDAEGPEANLPAPPPGVPSVTALEAVHVRSGPGTSYPSYGVAPKGASAELMGISETGAWWVVKIPQDIAPNSQGWVSADYVQVDGGENMPVIPSPPEPPEGEIPEPPEGTPTATALDAINVRSGPGTQYPAYFVAAKGAIGEVVGVSEDRGWWVVRLPVDMVVEGQGWVSADWVTTSNTEDVPIVSAPEQLPPVDAPIPPEGAPVATSLDYINVRTGPGLQYPSYGVVQPGVSAEILGVSEDGGWWAVKVNAVELGQAWVSADYVQAINAEGVPVLPAP